MKVNWQDVVVNYAYRVEKKESETAPNFLAFWSRRVESQHKNRLEEEVMSSVGVCLQDKRRARWL